MNFKNWFVENTLLLELNEKMVKVIDKIHEDPSEYPFKKIFEKAVPDNEEATRFIVPFTNDQIGTSILRKIEAEGYTIDLQKGLITKDKRSIRIGKYILDKKSPFTNDEKKWWITRPKATEALADVQDIDQYAIVISRNPFDVVRMGDFEEIRNQSGGRSCHHPGGSYFDCAIADANNSGAIAYVVKRDDLNKIDLNSKEIFYDDERKLDGIKPISRLRLRRFVNKKDENEDLAIPEQRLYGKPIPQFYETLKNTMASLQSNLIDSKEEKRPRMKDYILHGGHYEDTPASQLFNDFFGDKLDSGRIEHKTNTGTMADVWDEECSTITQDANNVLAHASVYADVDEQEGHVFVNAGGFFGFEIKNELVNVEFKDITKENWRLRNGINRNISDFLQNHTGIHVLDTEIEFEDNTLKISISIQPEEIRNPDDYRYFTQEIEREIDKKYDEIKKSLLNHLAYTDFLEEKTNTRFTLIKQPHYLPADVDVTSFDTESQTKFKNLVFDFDDVEKDYDAFIKSKDSIPLYVLDIKKYMPIVNKAIAKIENLDYKMQSPSKSQHKSEQIFEIAMYNQFVKVVREYNNKIDHNSIILQDLKNLYLKYERVENSQKHLFDEPEFKTKLYMTGHKITPSLEKEHLPTDIIKNILVNKSVVKIDVITKERMDYNATNYFRIHWTAFAELQIMFDSNKFTKQEHEMLVEFAEFIDQHFDELVKIFQKQLSIGLEIVLDERMKYFLNNTVLKAIDNLEKQTDSKNHYETEKSVFFRSILGHYN